MKIRENIHIFQTERIQLIKLYRYKVTENHNTVFKTLDIGTTLFTEPEYSDNTIIGKHCPEKYRAI